MRSEAVVDCARRAGDYRRAVFTAAREEGYREPAAIGHRQETDIAGVIVERAGLVLDHRVIGHQPADPVRTGRAAAHHVDQRRATACRQRLVAVDQTQEFEHRQRRAGIAQVPQIAAGSEQIGDVAIDADVAEPVAAQPAIDRQRASECGDQLIGRAIVAANHHPVHQTVNTGAVDGLV